MLVVQRVDILSQLFESQLRLGFAVRVVKDIHQLPDNSAEALPKPGVLFFQGGNGLLLLYRYIAWLLEEAPTQLPERLGLFYDIVIGFFFALCLDVPAIGAQRFFEVPPDILHRMEMVRLKSGVRIDCVDRFGKALRVVREGRGDMETKRF